MKLARISSLAGELGMEPDAFQKSIGAGRTPTRSVLRRFATCARELGITPAELVEKLRPAELDEACGYTPETIRALLADPPLRPRNVCGRSDAPFFSFGG